jgi:hypothetical protein
MRKNAGIFIWLIGSTALVALFSSAFIERSPPLTVAATALVFVFYGGIVFYNWLFGNQKGHVVHFIFIITYAMYAILILLSLDLGALNAYALLAATVLLLSIDAGILLKFKEAIYRDYRNGIKRDHFTNTTTKFK